MDDRTSTGNDKKTLHRNIRICFIFFLSVIDMIVESSYGPSVKDYQCIFRESRQRISLLYPILGTFKAIGTIVYFFLRNRLDTYLVATVCMTITCLLLVSIPLLPVLWLAILLTAVIGLAGGVASHARLAESGHLAKESAVPVHLFPLGLSTGSFLGPLIISPFLGENQIYVTKSCDGNTSNCNNTSISHVNGTMNITDTYECANFQSNLIYGFLVFLGIGGAMCLIYILFRNIFQNESTKDTEATNEQPKKDGENTTVKLEIIFLCLLGFVIIIGGPTNFIYGNMLSTFGIHSSLKLAPQLMALMTSSFYATTLIGRIIGAFVSLAVSQQILLAICMICSAAAATGLVFLSEISLISLWGATSVLAFMYSPIFGAIIAWSRQVSRAKHILYGLIIVADLGGLSLMSFLIGQLMNNVDMNYLNYCMLAVCVMQIAMFFIMYVISKFLKEQDISTLEITRL